MVDAYRAAMEAAEKELSEALAEREKLDTRILRLKQTTATLMRLLGTDVPAAISNKGITEAVREYLAFTRQQRPDAPVSVAELRVALEGVGYDFSRYKNVNASLSGTLERLHAAGEVKKKRKRLDGGVTVTGYVWLGPELQDNRDGTLSLLAPKGGERK